MPLGPGGIPLARRSRPVTLPIYHDNEPVDSGASPEKGPLQVFTWSAYVNPTVIKAFEKHYKVAVTLTSFENEEEALSKLTTGAVHFDVWFGTVQYLGKSVAGKLIQPLNHRYLPNLQRERLAVARQPVLRRRIALLRPVRRLHDGHLVAARQGQGRRRPSRTRTTSSGRRPGARARWP